MEQDEREPRGWLAETLGWRRHAALEETLFRQLDELEQGPLERLGSLVQLVIGELRSAQRRLTEQAVGMRTLQNTVAALAERVEQLEGRVHAEAPPAAATQGHLLLLTTPAGYRLVARDGAPPKPDDPIVHEGVVYRVLRGGRSPLPGDGRPCLLALPSKS
ncbi:MAG TPA: hypothetical protein VLN26_02940 [Gaiellaceae bacterium]|nr:hypothetical protein [Gaiellaceae bacterium]